MSEEPYIYVYRGDQQLGPFTERELRRHWANGVVDHDDLAWYEGMEEWISIRNLFGIPAAGPSIESEHRERIFSGKDDTTALSGLDTWEFFNGRRIDPLNVIAWVLFVLGVGLMALYTAQLAIWTPAFILSLGFATYNMLMRQRPLTFVLILANLVLPAVLWTLFGETEARQAAFNGPVIEERAEWPGQES